MKMTDIKVGDQLIVGEGFDCMAANEVKEVKCSPDGELYVCCTNGWHFLDAQLDGEEIVGLSKAL